MEGATTPKHFLRAWRKRRGLTQGQLAELAGVSLSLVSKLEMGIRRFNDDWLMSLSRALGVSRGQLLEVNPEAEGLSSALIRTPLIRVTAMPADTNPYGSVFGGWLMGQMGLACGSFASRLTRGKAILVAADAIKFPGAMAVGDELSVYVEILKQGRTSLRLKAEAIARQRDGDSETVVAEGDFTFVALDDAGKPREIVND